MIFRSQVNWGCERMIEKMKLAQIKVSDYEIENIEVTDFGLNNYPAEGAQIITFVNTRKVGFKIIHLLPGQILPEHMHTASLGEEGKEESFRMIWGQMSLYLPDSILSDNILQDGNTDWYTCKKEKIMLPPETITIQHDIKHWLKGGPSGCLVYSISSWARCALDPFTNPKVTRVTKIVEDKNE